MWFLSHQVLCYLHVYSQMSLLYFSIQLFKLCSFTHLPLQEFQVSHKESPYIFHILKGLAGKK